MSTSAVVIFNRKQHLSETVGLIITMTKDPNSAWFQEDTDKLTFYDCELNRFSFQVGLCRDVPYPLVFPISESMNSLERVVALWQTLTMIGLPTVNVDPCGQTITFDLGRGGHRTAYFFR